MNKTRHNIGANYIGQIWAAASVFIFVPFYLDFLGTEAYGLVGFYITLMGVLAFADIGLKAAITRNMASLSGKGDNQVQKGNVLKTYETIYFYIGFLIVFVVYFAAPYFANNWLESDVIAFERLVVLIQVMGVAIAFQLPANLFLGGLLGLQKQVEANLLQISWSMFRGLGSLAMLFLIAPTIEVFIYWQLLSNFLYFLFVRKYMWRAIGTTKLKYQFKSEVISSSWRYASGMLGMSLISIALLQLDKVLVSKYLTLELLGFYILAGTLATVPGVLGRPITRAIFPRFTILASRGKLEQLYLLYHKTSQVVGVIIIPTALVGAVFSYELMYIWVGSLDIALATRYVTSMLMLGALMQSLTAVPFNIALAFGNVGLNLKVGMFSIAIMTPLLLLFIPVLGIEGASLAWLCMNIVIVPPYMYFLHSYFLANQIKKWLWGSVMKPVSITLPILIAGSFMRPEMESKLLMFLYISGVWMIAFSWVVLATSSTRDIASAYIKKRGILCQTIK